MNKVEGFQTTHHMKMSKKFWKCIASGGGGRGSVCKAANDVVTTWVGGWRRLMFESADIVWHLEFESRLMKLLHRITVAKLLLFP
jgi:hypothetical protein